MDNELQFEIYFQQVLNESYNDLDNKFNEGQYRNFSDFDIEIRQLRNYLKKLEPQGPNKD